MSKQVTTVALLQRRDGLSDALFSAYWRDIHGVLAARIPGFWSYVQNHVVAHGAVDANAAIKVDGFAEVSFVDEADRNGLATSDVTQLILQDEVNVFSRTLLYSLAAGATRTPIGSGVPERTAPAASFVLVLQSPASSTAAAIAQALPQWLASIKGSPTALRVHELTSGDPALWSTTNGVDNRVSGAQNSVVLQVSWSDLDAAAAAIEQLRFQRSEIFTAMQAYRVTARYEMVMAGKPTMLGLRGLDALKTIEAAGADNQKSEAVIRCVYGASGLGAAA